MNQTRWNYPLNQQNLLIIHFNAWLTVTTRGCKAVSLRPGGGLGTCLSRDPVSLPSVGKRGQDPVPRGLSWSSGLPRDHWCVCGFTLSAANAKKAWWMQNAASPNTQEMPLRLWPRSFCFSPPKLSQTSQTPPEKQSTNVDLKELLIIRSRV